MSNKERLIFDSPARPSPGSPILRIGMGDGVVAGVPHIISSSGLGSCVVVTLYDSKRKLGGLAHIMLPDSHNLNGYHSVYECADTAIAALIKGLQIKRATLSDMVAKLVGGSSMFSSSENFSPGIGEQNIISTKYTLKQKRIPLIGENTGGNYGRNVEFYLDSGRVTVKAIGQEVREI